jgi:tRNA-dihydrouridine synthase
LAVETAHKVDPNFPIVANGGMENYDDVKSIIESTGAVAAMSSEALLETPNLFLKSSKHLTPRELLKQQLSFSRDYLGICADVMPPVPGILGPKKGGSFCAVRGHLFKFLHRYLNEHPDLREELASPNPMRNSISQALDLVNELEERYNILSEEELEARRSSLPESSWYRRHRKPDRVAHQKEIRVVSSLSATVREEQTPEERKRQIQDSIK